MLKSEFGERNGYITIETKRSEKHHGLKREAPRDGIASYNLTEIK